MRHSDRLTFEGPALRVTGPSHVRGPAAGTGAGLSFNRNHRAPTAVLFWFSARARTEGSLLKMGFPSHPGRHNCSLRGVTERGRAPSGSGTLGCRSRLAPSLPPDASCLWVSELGGTGTRGGFAGPLLGAGL